MNNMLKGRPEAGQGRDGADGCNEYEHGVGTADNFNTNRY